MLKNTQKKNSIFKDERDEEIHTKSKSYAEETMMLFSQICFITALIKHSPSMWAFLSIMLGGASAFSFYKYDKYEEQIYLYGSIIFIVIAIISLLKFMFV